MGKLNRSIDVCTRAELVIGRWESKPTGGMRCCRSEKWLVIMTDVVTCRGQAVKIILGAVIGPKYAFMANTLPASAHVETGDLVSFFIFLALFGEYSAIKYRVVLFKQSRLTFPAPMLLLPPERLQLPFRVGYLLTAFYRCNGLTSNRLLSS